jgi:sulfite reductase beta subunit-like hemoprotein
MSSINDATTFGRARLSFANESEVDEFASTLDKFERGEITADQWRAFRLVRGTYGQRQTDDASMLRIKIPQGILTGEQTQAIADVAATYSRGFGHITTRQNVQLHFIRLHDVEPAMRQLAAAGLTTREACGNSVRNITACPYSGVAADEAFDVTPYSEALTRYFLRHPLSSTLPRKFKIAFEGCPEDHAYTGIHDIGWRALVQDDEDGRAVRGFRVTVAGGTATMCRSGFVLYDFLPASEMLNIAEAIVRVFHRLGDYQHKARNRMKFLVKSLGWDAFRTEFEKELTGFLAEGGATLPFDPQRPPSEQVPDWPRPVPDDVLTVARRVAEPTNGPGIHPVVKRDLAVASVDYLAWEGANVRKQRQSGYALVIVSLPLGDITSGQLRVVADLAAAYGDGTIRVTADQDLLLRWIRVADLKALHDRLAAAGLAVADGESVANVTSCPGAESCKLAVTQSRGLGRLLSDALHERADLADAVPGLKIKMSGCPNGCGQHHIAGIGFQGSIRKLDGRPVPQYFVYVGGGPTSDGAQFGRLAAKIPARRAPAAVERLVGLYQRQRSSGESAMAFFQRAALEDVKDVLVDLEPLAAADATPEDFIDLGELAVFNPEVQDGECSA